MSSDERSRRSLEHRRELNRQAAQKLRNRQKEKAVVIKQEYFAAQSKNTQLSYEVKQLRKFKEDLKLQVDQHLTSCRRLFQPAVTTAVARSSHAGTVPAQQQQQQQQQNFAMISPSSLQFGNSQIVVCSDGSVQLVTLAQLQSVIGACGTDDAGVGEVVDHKMTFEDVAEQTSGHVEPVNTETAETLTEMVAVQETEQSAPLHAETSPTENESADANEVREGDRETDRREPDMEASDAPEENPAKETAAVAQKSSTAAESSSKRGRRSGRKRSTRSSRQNSNVSGADVNSEQNLPLVLSSFDDDDDDNAV